MYHTVCMYVHSQGLKKAIEQSNKEWAEGQVREMEGWEFEDMIDKVKRMGISVDGMYVGLCYVQSKGLSLSGDRYGGRRGRGERAVMKEGAAQMSKEPPNSEPPPK